MKSMTGFGLAASSVAGLTMDVSVKTVNGRFLETRMHLPRAYLPLENDLKKAVAQVFRRGTVDIFVVRRIGAKSEHLKVITRERLAEKWLNAFRDLGRKYKVSGEVDVRALMGLPDVFVVEEQMQVSAQEKQALLKGLKQALAKCDSERKREGKSLQKDLLKILADLLKFTQQIEKKRAAANEELEKKYWDRLKKLNFNRDEIDGRIAQEIAIQLDKVDINEELIRLKEHLANCQKLVNTVAGEGKKLDFYSQELLREINTIGSKSLNAELTEIVVECKSLVERFREQVQNVE